MTPDGIRQALARGELVPDEVFDALFPQAFRDVSRRYWTPVRVAALAAEWLAGGGARRVLDVGSGVGKVCLVGALLTDVHFTGLEQREPLVEAARSAARALGVDDRVAFVHDVVEHVDFTRFDAFYFYNPFGENLYERELWLDADVEMSADRFDKDVGLVERALGAMPVGARLVTYHGLGGLIPDTFSLEKVTEIGTDTLRLWVKRRTVRTGAMFEHGAGTMHLDGAKGPRS